MNEYRWIRLADSYESFRQYAQTVPTFNQSFGRREAFTYVVRAIPTDEWNDIVRERRKDNYPDWFDFVRAYYAKEVLSQPTAMVRFFQRIAQAHNDDPLSGTTGI